MWIREGANAREGLSSCLEGIERSFQRRPHFLEPTVSTTLLEQQSLRRMALGLAGLGGNDEEGEGLFLITYLQHNLLLLQVRNNQVFSLWLSIWGILFTPGLFVVCLYLVPGNVGDTKANKTWYGPCHQGVTNQWETEASMELTLI